MLSLHDIIKLDHEYYMSCFGERLPIAFTHGEGSTLYDTNGKKYTDFLAGIATNALGYNHKGFTEVICNQAHQILHCSNYFYIESQAQLAQALCEHSCADRAFFCNSGGEANEAAIKLVRKCFYDQNIDRYEIISAKNSFHGRTLATLAATGQEKYREAYAPHMPGFVNVAFNDIKAIEDAITPHTAAILLEVIQGEGGIIEADEMYLKQVRSLCDENGILLMLDEVQTGMGRTGTLFAYEHYGVEPDVLTLAKALGNGLPIGAVLCKEKYNVFTVGDHGTTFGGNPFCTTGALYVTNVIAQEDFLKDVVQKGLYLKTKLQQLKEKYPRIKDVRGKGLFIGVEFVSEYSVNDFKTAMIEQGFLFGTAGNNTLRIVPPLIITIEEIDDMLLIFEKTILM